MEESSAEQQPLPVEPEWAPRAESPADAEVVEGDVVQEMQGTPPVVDADTPPPSEAEAPKKGRHRGRGTRGKAAAEGGDSQAAAPRTRARKQPAEGSAPRARKAAKPRAPRRKKEEPA
jgi:hypothetical protein